MLPVLLVAAAMASAAELPHLTRNGAVTQMVVDGSPFLMLAGELHNSSASSAEYMQPVWNKLAALHLNTVIGTVSWELLEPEEGKFDFTLVDAQLADARRAGLRLVLIWFGSWKNASSSYVPMWVKTNAKRFPLCRTKTGGAGFMGMYMEALSPFGEASLAADAQAFRTLMHHIRETDPQHTVIMVQVENEVGLLGDSRDRSPSAEAAWSKPVPPELLSYLEKNKNNLLPEVGKVWGAQGYRTSGTWPEVFGTDEYADGIFMSWYVGRYVGKVTEAGKAELDLPMYVNAWLGPQPNMDKPGQYPSGGPVAGMMDVWRAAAPKIDLFAPDIYVADFAGVCASYTRSGNPLFIPEARASVPNLFLAVGRFSTLGYSPFGIEDLTADEPIGKAYGTLAGAMPLLMKAQASGKVTAVVEGAERETKIVVGGWDLKAAFTARQTSKSKQKDLAPAPSPDAEEFSTKPIPDRRGYALILSTGPDELIVIGSGVVITPASRDELIGIIDEGRFEKGQWIPGRRLNGDESFSGNLLMLPQEQIGIRKLKLYRRN